MVEKITCCGIEIWFPYIKAHYFFLNAALCAVLPYVQVYAQKFGFSAIVVGTIFMILPFTNMIFKPLFGFLSDYTKKMKHIFYFMLTLFSLSSICLAFIPATDLSAKGQIYCDNNKTFFSYANQSNIQCISKIAPDKIYYCDTKCMVCSNRCNDTEGYDGTLRQLPECCHDTRVVSSDINIKYNRTFPLGVFNVLNFDNTFLMQTFSDVECINNTYFSCNVTCDEAIHDCYKSNRKETQNTNFNLMQLLSYSILVLFIYLSLATLVTLGDTACFNVLGSRVHLYGKQRLFGTLGWGLSSPFWGMLNDWLSGKLLVQKFYGSFVFVIVLAIMDALVLRPVEMNSIDRPKSFVKDLSKILRVEICTFVFSVFMGGAMIGVLWTFLYWHLTILGASFLLLGLVPAFECLMGEIPFFFFASFIINKLGPFNSITLCLISGGIRFLLLSYIVDPWWVLPLGILQGPMLALLFATIATYARIAAPPGTEATMQGLLGGVFEGLGIGTGSLVGGIVMEKYGGSWMFFGAGLTTLALAAINLIATILLILKRKQRQKLNRRNKSNDAVDKSGAATCLNQTKEDEEVC